MVRAVTLIDPMLAADALVPFVLAPDRALFVVPEWEAEVEDDEPQPAATTASAVRMARHRADLEALSGVIID
jgi:hypothetical protein